MAKPNCYRWLMLMSAWDSGSPLAAQLLITYQQLVPVLYSIMQDRRVRLYDTQNNWRLRKDVTTRMTRWTITDTTLSPDQRLLVYASISPVAFVVNVGSSYDVVSYLQLELLVDIISGRSNVRLRPTEHSPYQILYV